MATTASPSTSTTASPTTPAPNTMQVSPASLFNNLPHRVTAQLTRDNYLTWQWQMVTYLKSQNAFGFVDGSITSPPQTIPNPSPSEDSLATIGNPAFLTWMQQDQMVLSTIISTISESLISQVIGYSTVAEVWSALERLYSSQSMARIMQVHYQLATLKKAAPPSLSTSKSLKDLLIPLQLPANHSMILSWCLSPCRIRIGI
jgi:hypothetical protein